MNRTSIALLTASLLALLPACGGDVVAESGSTSSSSVTGGGCDPFQMGSECSACAQAACSGELQALTTACSDLISCIQSCGCSSQCTDPCVETSTPTLSCGMAADVFETCEETNCGDQCFDSGSSGTVEPAGGTTTGGL